MKKNIKLIFILILLFLVSSSFGQMRSTQPVELKRISEHYHIRADIDDREESVSRKIRDAEKEWIPIIIVVGEKEKNSKKFNPRIILLKALLGAEEELVGKDSPIWLCTNCYSCYERCPQDVRPLEVIIALKNMAVERGTAPTNLAKLSENIAKTGMSVTVSSAVNRRRQELGLPDLKPIPLEELNAILEEEAVPASEEKIADK